MIWLIVLNVCVARFAVSLRKKFDEGDTNSLIDFTIHKLFTVYSKKGDNKAPQLSRKLKNRRRKQGRKSKTECPDYGTYEPRRVLNAVPFVNHDLDFVTDLNTTLTISSTSEGVLANDFDVEGSTLTSSKIFDPTNDSLTLNSNGTFTYVPDTGFEGVDEFTYRVSDGTDNSALARVQITVGDGLSGRLNGDEMNQGDWFHDGVLRLTQPLGSGLNLVCRSDSIPVVLVPVESMLTPETAIPNSITANLTIDGVSSGDVTFDNTGIVAGESFRFVLRALNTTTSTGVYDWTVTADLNYTGSTEFGTGWWLDGLERLHTSSEGALLVRGDGTTVWFEKDGSNYLPPKATCRTRHWSKTRAVTLPERTNGATSSTLMPMAS